MLDTCRGSQGSFSARSDVDDFNPKQIAPTLAMKAPPPNEELMKVPSRFYLKPKDTENVQKWIWIVYNSKFCADLFFFCSEEEPHVSR